MSNVKVSQRYVSDELTHFVGGRLPTDDARYELLLHIVRSGVLKAPGLSDVTIEHTPDGPRTTVRHTITVNDDKVLSSNEKYCASIVCFADIPVDDLQLHITKYGPFGISFAKRFLVARGANPVFYVASQSSTNVRNPLANDPLNADQLIASSRAHRNRGHWENFTRAELFDAAERVHQEVLPLFPRWDPVRRTTVTTRLTSEQELLRQFLSTHLFAYIKFFDPELADDDPQNFYMEREWRVVEPVSFVVGDVRRVLIPEAFASRLRHDIPEYEGQVTFA